jgi:hypothetical protein
VWDKEKTMAEILVEERLHRIPLAWSEPCRNPICDGSKVAWNKYVDTEFSMFFPKERIEVIACCRACADMIAKTKASTFLYQGSNPYELSTL